MEVTYQLTPQDYRHAQIAWRNSSAYRRWTYRFFVAIMTFVGLFSAWMICLDKSPDAVPDGLKGLGVTAFWLLLIFVLPVLNARGQFKRTPGAQVPTALTIAEEGLHFRSAHSDSQVKWSSYAGWGEDKSVFIIVLPQIVLPQPRSYVPIPKRAFPAEQIEEFRQLLKRSIQPG